jgi:hypothetical protein
VRLPTFVAFVLALGCSSNADDGVVDDATAAEVAVTGDASRDETAIADAERDARTDTTPRSDVAPEASTTGCEGFSTKPLVAPTVCDKASGNTTSEKSPNSLYATSNFGCYRKADGTIYKDPSDNCLFACGNMGLCPGITDGPTCEATLRWFTADADRFGCGKRIRLVNCLNGKRAVAVALDRGPNCKNEQTYGVPVIDMSHDLMVHLFDGKLYGGVDKKRILVEEVDATTKLGPE